MESEFFLLLLTTIFAGLLGYELISRIPQTLHTPLMSGSNAISGITILAALTYIDKLNSNPLLITLVYISVAFAMINIVGGFLVTNRMLEMFRKKK
tara:strand:- start:80 stop:367 length:288 start_codon:yes stop_codon:yes gene_type:complete